MITLIVALVINYLILAYLAKLLTRSGRYKWQRSRTFAILALIVMAALFRLTLGIEIIHLLTGD